MRRTSWAAILLIFVSIFMPITQGLCDVIELEDGAVHHGKKLMETADRILFKTKDGEELVLQKARVRTCTIDEADAQQQSSERVENIIAHSANVSETVPIDKAPLVKIVSKAEPGEVTVRRGRRTYAFKRGDKLWVSAEGTALRGGPNYRTIARLPECQPVTVEDFVCGSNGKPRFAKVTVEGPGEIMRGYIALDFLEPPPATLEVLGGIALILFLLFGLIWLYRAWTAPSGPPGGQPDTRPPHIAGPRDRIIWDRIVDRLK